MAVGVRAVGTAVAISATPGTVTIPAATQTGDLLTLFVALDQNTYTLTTPTGWTVTTMTAGNNPQDPSISADSRHYTLQRVAQAGDGGTTVSLAFSAVPHVVAGIIAWSGQDSTTPISEARGSGDSGLSTHISASVTALNGDAIAFAMSIDKTSATEVDYFRNWILTTGSVAMTEAWELRETGSNEYGAAAYRLLTADYTGTAQVDARTGVSTADADDASMHVLVIKQAAAAPSGSPPRPRIITVPFPYRAVG